MNIGAKKIDAVQFHREFHRTGAGEHAIFSGRKPLLDKLFATGVPIYCDQSYYVHEQQYDLVTKVGEHYECDCYKEFENWRDCHYFSEWANKEGDKVWLMTGAAMIEPGLLRATRAGAQVPARFFVCSGKVANFVAVRNRAEGKVQKRASFGP